MREAGTTRQSGADLGYVSGLQESASPIVVVFGS
jgi:hypothetical protein